MKTLGTLALTAFVGAPAAAQVCEPHWSDEFAAHTVPGVVRVMEVLDGPAGPTLYIGTVGGIAGDGWLAQFDGNRIDLVDRFGGELVPGGERSVFAITSFDDGAGPALYAGGDFTAAGGVAANGVARLGPNGWTPLGEGTDATVRALAGYDDGSGPALYAGGFFSQAGGVPASRIARWSGGSWAPLGAGMTGGMPPFPNSAPTVLALTVFDDGHGPRLYAGGTFDQADGLAAANVASYGPGGWSSLADGLTGPEGSSVLALHVSDFEGPARLYAGGQFSQSGGSPFVNIARWDGRSWSAVGTGVPGYNVSSLATHEIGGVRTLIAGAYLPVGGVGGSINLIYRYDGQSWVSLGPVTSGPIRTVRSFGRHVCAGGAFSLIGGMSASNIARWDGAWSRLPNTGAAGPLDRLRVIDDGAGPAMYVFGFTSTIAGQSGAGPARFDGKEWSYLPTAGLTGTTMDDVAYLDDGSGPMLYACGSAFSAQGGRIARLNNGTWEIVGNATSPMFNNPAHVLRAFDDSIGHVLFAGGSSLTNGVRAWDGAQWTIPGGGIPSSTSWQIVEFEVFDEGAGPRLWAATTSALWRWNTISWEQVALPVPAGPSALAAFDDGSGGALFVGSNQGIFRYDGKAWTVVLQGQGLSIRTLAGFNDGAGQALYAAGNFTAIGGTPAARIARFSRGVWSPLDERLDAGCDALVPYAGSLWGGGEFLVAGSTSSGHIARWMGCACYPDCNTSGSLTVADFTCFQTKFVAGDPYADCNTSGTLTVEDFTCFQTRFAAGCP